MLFDQIVIVENAKNKNILNIFFWGGNTHTKKLDKKKEQKTKTKTTNHTPTHTKKSNKKK